MLCRQLLDQQAAPPTIFNSGAKSPLTKAFVQLAPFPDQTNTIISLTLMFANVNACATMRLQVEVHNT